MANYYTTRFNPVRWPTPDGSVPPGVEWDHADLLQQGVTCCERFDLRGFVTEAGEERWAFRTVYRTSCAAHGESAFAVESRLDWISPNEYLLLQSEPSAPGERTTE